MTVKKREKPNHAAVEEQKEAMDPVIAEVGHKLVL